MTRSFWTCWQQTQLQQQLHYAMALLQRRWQA
jgi:hypothetical protein